MGVVLLSSTLAMVFVVFYVMLNFPDEPEDAPSWWRGTSYTGVVIAIDETRLTLHADKDLEFKIEPNTRFILRGNSPVRAGAEVKVTFRAIRGNEGNTLLARTVRMLRSDAEMPASGTPSAGMSPSVSPSSGTSPSASAGAPRSPSTGAPAAAGSSAPAGSASPR